MGVKVTRIPGVFPFVDIERDGDGYPIKVTVKGTMDQLEVFARGDAEYRWLEVKLNGEDKTYSDQ